VDFVVPVLLARAPAPFYDIETAAQSARPVTTGSPEFDAELKAALAKKDCRRTQEGRRQRTKPGRKTSFCARQHKKERQRRRRRLPRPHVA